MCIGRPGVRPGRRCYECVREYCELTHAFKESWPSPIEAAPSKTALEEELTRAELVENGQPTRSCLHRSCANARALKNVGKGASCATLAGEFVTSSRGGASCNFHSIATGFFGLVERAVGLLVKRAARC